MGRFWRSGPGSEPATWGVVLLAQEPGVLVLTHLAWHRAAGAAEVHLYLDDPTDPVAEAAARLPGVRVTRCDAQFWAAHPSGRRPALVTARQSWCATQAYRAATSGWLLHLDADEFLAGPPLGPELERHAGHPGAVVIPVRERAYAGAVPDALLAGVFRIPQPPARRSHPLLAPLAEVAPAGVLGHALGKSATRTGLPLRIDCHFPKTATGEDAVPKVAADGPVLLHFDGLTPAHWLAKQRARIAVLAGRETGFLGPHRRAQIAALAACGGDPVAERALHDRLRVIADPGPWMAAGLVESRPFDPALACRAVLGALHDLTVAGFDAAAGLA
jgi:hypothetical protein